MAKRRKKTRTKRKSKTPNTMAKRRKKGRRRSRRMSGAGKGFDFMSPLAAAGGAVVARLLDKVIPATVNPKLVAGGKMVVGALLPMVSKDVKTKSLLQSAGNGMVAIGTSDLLKEFGVLSGTDKIDDLDEKADFALELSDDILNDKILNDDVNVVNDDVNVVNGNDDYDDFSQDDDLD
jgi:hypothetical protein